jgi:hypothetical protein
VGVFENGSTLFQMAIFQDTTLLSLHPILMAIFHENTHLSLHYVPIVFFKALYVLPQLHTRIHFSITPTSSHWTASPSPHSAHDSLHLQLVSPGEAWRCQYIWTQQRGKSYGEKYDHNLYHPSPLPMLIPVA